jgi:hypothetical protein
MTLEVLVEISGSVKFLSNLRKANSNGVRAVI